MNLCTDPFLKVLLEERGIQAEIFDNVLSKIEKQKMLESLEEFASNWFIQNNKDISEYRNVSIGAAIHDDVLIYFHLILHVAILIEKINYGENNIVFYQSISCRLPDNIERFLKDIGVKMKTTNDKYPFPCYKKAFEYSGFSRKTYTGIVYDLYYKIQPIANVRPHLRYFFSRNICLFGNIFTKRSKKMIYFRPMRRLNPILSSWLENHNRQNNIQVQVPFPETNLSIINRKFIGFSPLKSLRLLIILATKGIFLVPSKYFQSTENGFIKNLNKLFKIKASQNPPDNIDSLVNFFNFQDIKISSLFIINFLEFYSFHFHKFTKQVSKLHREVKRNKVKTYILEYVNPFLAQVLAFHKKNIYFIHVSRFLNNQYFCDRFIHKVNKLFFVLVSSEFEYQRVLKQGFKESSIIKLHESYFNKNEIISNVQKGIGRKKNFLNKKTVLITTPPLAALWTYRLLLDSTFFINFVCDIITTLERFNVSTIIVRPSPGSSKSINDLSYTEDDFNKYLMNALKPGNYNLIVRTGRERNNIQKDLEKSDLVIGTLSASAIDAALSGLDYIAYDNSIVPFPDTINFSIFSNNSTIPIISNTNDLFEYLEEYQPKYGRDIMRSIKPYQESNRKIQSLENFTWFK